MKNTLFLFFLISLTLSCNNKEHLVYNPPSILPNPIEEIYHGKKVIDEYRNIENIEDSIVKNWYKKQTVYSDSILNQIIGRNDLMLQMKDIDNRKDFFVKKVTITENDTYFYLKKNKGDDQYKLYMRYGYDGVEGLLYDPKDFKPNLNNTYTINYIGPSWEGDFIVVSLSHSGKELSEMIIIETKTRKVLPQTIDKAWPSSFLGVSWLPDNSGFIFLQFPIVDSSHPEFKRNTQSVLYKLGDEPNKTKIIFSAKTHPRLNINPNEYPIVKYGSKNSNYAIGYLAGVDNFWDAYYIPINDVHAKHVNWKSFYKKELST